MAVTIRWDNPQKTIMIYELIGKWTWEEFYAAFESARAMIEALPHIVDFICCVEAAPGPLYLPPNTLLHIRGVYANSLPNAGITVVVGGDDLARSIFNILTRISPQIAQRFKLAASIEQAHLLLQQQRAAS
ncbi:MAG: hypothetical protein HXY40_10740 [Chloroflexi bacterium]|nr:hypothetical protein [Chloroflexota bacterium]